MTKARTLADNYAADINQVSAGVGITGGGTSGTVTITNDMATSINAKGDLVVGTANDTYSRLAVASTAGYVLTVDSAEATGLKWAAASSSSGPTFAADKTSSQTLTGNTLTKITFAGTKWDTDSCFSTANSRFTPNKAGYYLITTCLYVAGSAIYTNVRKNGVDTNDFAVGSSAGTYAPASASIWYLNGSTDYIEFYCYPNSASNQTALGYPNARFEGVFLRS